MSVSHRHALWLPQLQKTRHSPCTCHCPVPAPHRGARSCHLPAGSEPADSPIHTSSTYSSLPAPVGAGGNALITEQGGRTLGCKAVDAAVKGRTVEPRYHIIFTHIFGSRTRWASRHLPSRAIRPKSHSPTLPPTATHRIILTALPRRTYGTRK